LEAHEVNVMRFLGRELRRLLEYGDPEQGVLKPFHPMQQRGADPECVPSELDQDMDMELMRCRLDRIDAIQEHLLRVEEEEAALEQVLSETDLDNWLAYLTDLRLLVSAVIGITPENPDPLDPDPDEWTMEQEMYVFLSALQEGLLGALEASA
jgi:hypothetical protein